jgi:hypothetical protein
MRVELNHFKNGALNKKLIDFQNRKKREKRRKNMFFFLYFKQNKKTCFFIRYLAEREKMKFLVGRMNGSRRKNWNLKR